MPLSGKYDFKGIKKQGASGIKLALASNPGTAAFAKIPLIGSLLEFGVNWLANNGLIVINIGAIVVDGEVDQNLLDRNMEAGLKRVESGEVLTPEKIKEIDDEVIKSADRFLPYTRK